MKEIVFVVDWYTPSSHATSLRVRPWIDQLRSSGKYDITIYTDKVSAGEVGVKTNFVRSPDNRKKFTFRFLQEIFLGIELFVKLLFAKKTIVVISSPPFLAAILAAKACRLTGKPYVFDVRDLYPLVYANSGYLSTKSMFYKLLDTRATNVYKRAMFTTTVTPGLVEYLLKEKGNTRVHMVKNGYNSKLFIPATEKFEHFTLVFHGNIGQFQNPELLKEVMTELENRKEEIHCIVIGSGSRQDVFEKHPIPNLKYYGRLNNERLASIIRKGHVGISFRTENEISMRSIPVRVSEYIGIGIPILLTPKSEASEILELNQVGKSFNNDQLKEICDFIIELKYNKELYNYYCQNALKIRADFSRETGAVLFQNLLEYYSKA
jgi:glycosyltransferase involved in cell wall biosynthesis